MSGKNKSFAEGLAAGLVPGGGDVPRARGQMGSILSGRENRIAQLASGAIVQRTHELVDPARCRLWAGHNRDYALLNEQRCADLIESLKSQGRQEVPAIVRRVRGDADHDFEIICGARRHWSVSWLRAHNYPEFRFLVEPRELTDEEAFRLADLENRAREDITDIERARDYLKALEGYYQGHQGRMAERLNVSQSWLSRYLDLARLPDDLMIAFPDPHALRIKHVTMLKPLLKPDDQRKRVTSRAAELARQWQEGGGGLPVVDIIRDLAGAAADAPKKTGVPRKTGSDNILRNREGNPILKIDRQTPRQMTLTLLPKGGGTREEAEAALLALVRDLWA
ncbi:ParB/RepB/Spo0J family partition protein [Sphingobium sp. CCH11-B1]|jgi:ParB family chromosome partitioning protein|uniref:ParB/RepB/Spo0J family partition protein n=1 Tax=Sphingobium sp. CCH11-B1 TaxID=1768781 RepID=UPI0008356CCB|nr:ParB/RepB/Spo0J family partition protein [Sphingobium sp. CCH11-B1]MEA3389403.1 ParB/RepB/Spo0J family partition protein [Pseudomonadota bacterium]